MNLTKFLVFPLSFKQCKYYCTFNIACQISAASVLVKLVLAWYVHTNPNQKIKITNQIYTVALGVLQNSFYDIFPKKKKEICGQFIFGQVKVRVKF